MTGPEDSHAATRPISVAELLAKNGTIGAPPVGGRRRRRRGNSDAVTVAELTGEIPIVTDHADEPEEPSAEKPEEPPADKPHPARPDDTDVVSAAPAAPTGTNGATVTAATAEAEAEATSGVVADAEADYQAHLDARDTDPEPVEFKPSTRRPQYSNALRDYRPSGSGAERMSPDFVDDNEDDDSTKDDDRPTYLGSTLGPLFGGQSVADDLARRRVRPGPEDIDLDDRDDHDEHDDHAEPVDAGEADKRDEAAGAAGAGRPSLVHGLLAVGQCIIAVAFGAGLFIAFDQLWKWNTIIALVLGVLVILGLAGGVRVVRKTEDIGSTLTAVAVGALVTFGPLALLQAS
jgi:hypothetical protein